MWRTQKEKYVKTEKQLNDSQKNQVIFIVAALLTFCEKENKQSPTLANKLRP